jgi:hypothetical protein
MWVYAASHHRLVAADLGAQLIQSLQRFYIYAERGLARQRVLVWLYEGRLHLEMLNAIVWLACFPSQTPQLSFSTSSSVGGAGYTSSDCLAENPAARQPTSELAGPHSLLYQHKASVSNVP